MKFVIIVTGSNVWIRQPVKNPFRRETYVLKQCGFVTTRIVTALNRQDACRLAIESAWAELEGQVANDPSDPSKFEIDEGDICSYELEAEVMAPNRGFIFF